MMKDVHTEHCCLIHGCKYGDEDCTVTNKIAPQSGPCESCGLELEGYFGSGMQREASKNWPQDPRAVPLKAGGGESGGDRIRWTFDSVLEGMVIIRRYCKEPSVQAETDLFWVGSEEANPKNLDDDDFDRLQHLGWFWLDKRDAWAINL